MYNSDDKMDITDTKEGVTLLLKSLYGPFWTCVGNVSNDVSKMECFSSSE